MHHDGTERSIDPDDLAHAYDKLVIGGVFQEQGDYYVRYRNRYESLVSTYAELGGGGSSLDVLEVGGGQHALLAHALFADRAAVADLPGPHLDYLSSCGISTVHWDLLTEEQPFREAFDRIFLCEVMAHLPVPPYQYLDRLRLALRPGGVLLVSTPNLHRLRNIALLLAGRDPFGPFAAPEPGTWRGSFLDFSAPHLRWQLERAGFAHVMIERREFSHRASSLPARLANLALRPLTLIPYLRYNLVATAIRPQEETGLMILTTPFCCQTNRRPSGAKAIPTG
jgi:SAM-dependent methyltransferase